MSKYAKLCVLAGPNNTVVLKPDQEYYLALNLTYHTKKGKRWYSDVGYIHVKNMIITTEMRYFAGCRASNIFFAMKEGCPKLPKEMFTRISHKFYRKLWFILAKCTNLDMRVQRVLQSSIYLGWADKMLQEWPTAVQDIAKNIDRPGYKNIVKSTLSNPHTVMKKNGVSKKMINRVFNKYPIIINGEFDLINTINKLKEAKWYPSKWYHWRLLEVGLPPNLVRHATYKEILYNRPCRRLTQIEVVNAGTIIRDALTGNFPPPPFDEETICNYSFTRAYQLANQWHADHLEAIDRLELSQGLSPLFCDTVPEIISNLLLDGHRVPLTKRELVDLGRQESHCVGGYDWSIREKRSFIAYFDDLETTKYPATVEVEWNTGRILQTKHSHNREPNEETKKEVRGILMKAYRVKW